MVSANHDPLKVAVEQVKAALDLALQEAKNLADAGSAAVSGGVGTAEKAASGAEGLADKELDQVVTTLEGMLKSAGQVTHVLKG